MISIGSNFRLASEWSLALGSSMIVGGQVAKILGRAMGSGAALLLAFSLMGCHQPGASESKIASPDTSKAGTSSKPDNVMNDSTEKGSVQRLIVSRRNVGRLGTVQFDKSNRATLTTEGTSPEVDALKKAWDELSKKPKLSRVITVIEERAGNKVTAIEEQEVKPGEENYIYAVFDTLSRKYGFSVEMAK
jgi:hypothetical protein